MTELTDLEMVQSKCWRCVLNRRRAKKLAKRGEYIKWSSDLDCWVWEPYWHAPNPSSADGLPWVGHKEFLNGELNDTQVNR